MIFYFNQEQSVTSIFLVAILERPGPYVDLNVCCFVFNVPFLTKLS